MSEKLVFVDPRDHVAALSEVFRSANAEFLERRSSLENPQVSLGYPNELLMDIFAGGRTDAGVRVSELNALEVSTVIACVNLIGRSVGSLPLNVYEHILARDNRVGKRLAFSHDIHDLLHDRPNDEMTSMTFRYTLQTHALLWGNLYAEIQRDNGNRIVALWPRNPARTRPYRTAKNVLVYRTTEGQEEISNVNETYSGTNERTIAKEDMLHIPGLTLDGRIGRALIQGARNIVGLSLAAERFGAKLFSNYARPGGVLQAKGKLSEAARKNIKESWALAQTGENVHTIPVLEEDLEWKDTASKPNEAQFIETRKFQKTEICSIFAVPPHMVGDSDKTNRANTEQIGLEFMNFTLAPWLVAWEQELKAKLFPKVGRNANKFFAMYDSRRLTMPEAASRQGFYSTGKQWGFLSTNDIRELEHMNPIDDPDADALWIPLNMIKSGAELSPADNQEDLSDRAVKAYSRIFRDSFGRILTRTDPDAEAFKRAFLPVLWTIAEQIHRAASPYFGSEPTSTLDLNGFLVDYIGSMRNRLAAWRDANGEIDQVAREELRKAVKAIGNEIYRTAGRKQLEEKNEND